MKLPANSDVELEHGGLIKDLPTKTEIFSVRYVKFSRVFCSEALWCHGSHGEGHLAMDDPSRTGISCGKTLHELGVGR